MPNELEDETIVMIDGDGEEVVIDLRKPWVYPTEPSVAFPDSVDEGSGSSAPCEWPSCGCCDSFCKAWET